MFCVLFFLVGDGESWAIFELSSNDGGNTSLSYSVATDHYHCFKVRLGVLWDQELVEGTAMYVI